MKKGFLREERGVEPLAMQIFAGIVLLVIGLGIGIAVYNWASGGAQQMLSFTVTVGSGTSYSTTMGIPDSDENTKNVSVSVGRMATYDKTVTLTATGMPTGVTASFSPASGIPAFGSTMTISVSSEAVAGTTTITVKGTGSDDAEQTATFTLTLE